MRAFTPSDNKIIQPTGSDPSLSEVKSFPELKPGEIVLRVRYSSTDYRLYKGILASTAFDPSVSLFSFQLPANMSGSQAAVIKFYKEEIANPDADESMLYFDNNRIYARFISRLFYNDGTFWKTIDAVNLSGDKRKSRPLGDILVSSTPEHAEIIIDGKSTGAFTTNYVPDLFEGKHSLKLQLKNYLTVDTTVTVRAGKTEKLSLQLKSALGSLTLSSNPPGATVKINGVKSGVTPFTLNGLGAGKYLVEMEYEFFKNESTELTVNMNQDTKWEVSLKPDFGIVNIPKMPHAVTVSIDGKERDSGAVKLNSGTHYVQFNGGNLYADKDTAITLDTNQTVQLSPVMQRLMGSIKVLPIPVDAEIFVNGKSYGTGPQIIDSLPTGNYTVICKRNGFKDGTQSVEVNAGETGVAKFSLIGDSSKTSESQQPAGEKISVQSRAQENLSLKQESGTFTQGKTASTNNTYFGQLTIITRPQNSLIYFDNKNIGSGKVTLDSVTAGTHSIEAFVSDKKKEKFYTKFQKDIILTSSSDHNYLCNIPHHKFQFTVSPKFFMPIGFDHYNLLGQAGIRFNFNCIDFSFPIINSYPDEDQYYFLTWSYDKYPIPDIFTISPLVTFGYIHFKDYNYSSYSYYDINGDFQSYSSDNSTTYDEYAGLGARIKIGYKCVFIGSDFSVLFGSPVCTSMAINLTFKFPK